MFISENVKYCRLCRQHTRLELCYKHKCPYEGCVCEKCSIIIQQRQIMSKQMHHRRNRQRFNLIVKQKLSSPFNIKYSCQRCKNHGIFIAKKVGLLLNFNFQILKNRLLKNKCKIEIFCQFLCLKF